jgi:hypothetical protein
MYRGEQVYSCGFNIQEKVAEYSKELQKRIEDGVFEKLSFHDLVAIRNKINKEIIKRNKEG